MINRNQSTNYWRYIFRKQYENSSSPYLFSHARAALKYGLKSLNLKTAGEILVPEYVCEAILQPIKQVGLVPKFYPLNKNLEPVWDKVEQLVSSDTNAVLAIHYFGIAQDIKTFSDFCSKNALHLIEDNAHGFGGSVNGQLLGTFGDMGITSPRKTLPTLSGGILYTKSNFEQVPSLTLEPRPVVNKILIQSFKAVLRPFQPLSRFLKSRPPYEEMNAFNEKEVGDWGLDALSAQIILNANYMQISEKRRRLYQIWNEWATKNDLQPVITRPIADSAPYCFAAYAPTSQQCVKWFDWGYRQGIVVSSWPSLPKVVQAGDFQAKSYWEKLLCFPINLKMDPQVLQNKLNSYGTVRFK